LSRPSDMQRLDLSDIMSNASMALLPEVSTIEMYIGELYL